MSTVKDLLLLNLCWILCSLPIVTFGVATVAVFDVTLRMVRREEGYVVRQFFAAFRSNLRQGFFLGLITLLCAEVVYLDMQLFEKAEGNPIYFLIAGIVCGFLFLFSLLYAYPQAARYQNGLPRILKNSFRISMKYFFRTVVLLIALAAELVVILWNTKTLIFGILLGPALLIYTVSFMANAIFTDLEKEAAS